MVTWSRRSIAGRVCERAQTAAVSSASTNCTRPCAVQTAPQDEATSSRCCGFRRSCIPSPPGSDLHPASPACIQKLNDCEGTCIEQSTCVGKKTGPNGPLAPWISWFVAGLQKIAKIIKTRVGPGLMGQNLVWWWHPKFVSGFSGISPAFLGVIRCTHAKVVGQMLHDP